MGKNELRTHEGVYVMPVDLDREAQKEAIKEAISEWLDTQFAIVGRWTINGILAAALAGLLYAWLTTKGFRM